MSELLLAITIIFLQVSLVLGEDFGQAFSHTQKNDNASDETYTTIAFSAFLAFCILSVIATLGYFSILEDKLMKRYLKEGEAIVATVVSAEFARGGANAGQWGAMDDERATEYVLLVEYVKPICEGSYTTKIRKQVKAKEEDIMRPPRYKCSVQECEASVPLDSPLQVQKMLQMLHDEENALNSSEGLGKIEMLVMPNFQKSGISRRQVERSNDYRHRLSSLALLLSGFSLAAFCIRLAAKAISNDDNIGIGDTNAVTWYISGVFAVLLFLECMLLHCCLKKTFVEALEEVYLKNGDLVPSDEDDSSLSTGSDFFLGKSRQERIIGMPPYGDPITAKPPISGPIPKTINSTLPRYPATVNL